MRGRREAIETKRKGTPGQEGETGRDYFCLTHSIVPRTSEDLVENEREESRPTGGKVRSVQSRRKRTRFSGHTGSCREETDVGSGPDTSAQRAGKKIYPNRSKGNQREGEKTAHETLVEEEKAKRGTCLGTQKPIAHQRALLTGTQGTKHRGEETQHDNLLRTKKEVGKLKHVNPAKYTGLESSPGYERGTISVPHESVPSG